MAWFDWTSRSSTSNTELPDIFPIPITERDFVSIDVENIYARILTDALERTQGIPTEAQNLLWDNCLASEKQEGLVTLVAKAMVMKQDLFLIFDRATKVIRKATQPEEQRIRDDYKARGESQLGVYITFKNYTRTDMVKFYSQLEYCAIGGLWKQSNISKAIQLKLTDLRGSVSLTDSADVKTQAVALANGLAQGKDVMLDAKDILETAKPDMTALTSTMDFIAQKRSFYLGMPATYLTGEQSKGLGDSGKGDSKATERGLKAYYFSVAKPVVEGIFKIKTTFKSEDSEGLSTALETLKTMDITSDEYLSRDNKTLVVNKAFGLDASEKGDDPEPQPTPPPQPVNAPPAPQA